VRFKRWWFGMFQLGNQRVHSMPRLLWTILAWILALIVWKPVAMGTGPDDSFADRSLEDQQLDIQAVQLLQLKCGSCHGAEQAEGGLRVDALEWLQRGGERGQAIMVGRASDSLLYQTISGMLADLQMPPKSPLSADEILLIERWLQAGAHWVESADSTMKSTDGSPDAGDVSENSPRIGDAWSDPRNPIRRIFGGQRLGLWSLKPVVTSELPGVQQTQWCQNDLDRWAMAGFEAAGVVAPQMADMHTLSRRLHYDLTGLPPPPDVTDRFKSAGDRQAIEALVDSLLDSPQFGIHWGRMWLDVVRYSDSNGFDWDEFRPQAWRYRDYVIRSLNEDKPYDQFLREQLAGDEMLVGSPRNAAEQDALIATGFLRMGPHDNAAKLFNEQDRSRDELLTDLVETTGNALLGMTLSCCRCHDHKYDPLSQADHFRLRACFAGVKFADDLPIDLDHERLAIEEHNARIDAEIEKLNPAAEDDEERLQAIEKEREQLHAGKRSFTYAMLMIDERTAPETFVLFQGDYKSPRTKVEPGLFSVLDPNPLKPIQPSRAESLGRRTALAEWIVARDNPFTARVMVNRIWLNLMGQGLVRTPGDFGFAGSAPEDPQLLDWLARRFIDEGWSIKRLVRMIVMSATYQQAASYGELDPRVTHLLRQPRRLTAEQLRDSMLQVSGLLTDQDSGPPRWPDLPTEVLEANPAFLDDNETKTKGWYPSPLADQYCRSIFLVQKRNTRVPLLETFDQPENSVSCQRRDTSIVAPQALTLLNGPEAVAAARSFARRIHQMHEFPHEPTAQVLAAFRLALGRQPSQAELEQCDRLLQQASLTELCRVLLNTNEFAFVD
jgi:hypothetical protein